MYTVKYCKKIPFLPYFLWYFNKNRHSHLYGILQYNFPFQKKNHLLSNMHEGILLRLSQVNFEDTEAISVSK